MSKPTIQHCYAAGLTLKQSSVALGCAYGTACRYAREAGLRFPKKYDAEAALKQVHLQYARRENLGVNRRGFTT